MDNGSSLKVTWVITNVKPPYPFTGLAKVRERFEISKWKTGSWLRDCFICRVAVVARRSTRWSYICNCGVKLTADLSSFLWLNFKHSFTHSRCWSQTFLLCFSATYLCGSLASLPHLLSVCPHCDPMGWVLAGCGLFKEQEENSAQMRSTIALCLPEDTKLEGGRLEEVWRSDFEEDLMGSALMLNWLQWREFTFIKAHNLYLFSYWMQCELFCFFFLLVFHRLYVNICCSGSDDEVMMVDDVDYFHWGWSQGPDEEF